MAHKKYDEVTGTETTGHEWDGIEELNKPLPKWWLWTFYATIVWAIGYWLLMPAWPLVASYTKGWLGYSQRERVTGQVDQAKAAQAVFRRRIATSELETISTDPELLRFALAGGEAPSATIARPAMDAAHRGFPAIPICVTIPGSGAAASKPSTRRSPMASVRLIPTRMAGRCRLSAAY